MTDRHLDTGQTFYANDVKFEVTAVSYQENDEGEKTNFNYTVRPQADIQAERDAAEKAQQERLAAEEAARETNQEETQYDIPA